MEQHFLTLSLTAGASLEEAHHAYHKLAEQYHPDNVSNMYAKSHYRQQLIVVDKAWVAIQGHFHRKDKENSSEAKKYEWYFSYAELLFMAKRDQEYQRGAIRVRFDAKLHPGLYEEHERICIRSKGYVFDGEAEVIRDNGIDIINGSPTFKNAIFEKSVMFAPRKSLTTNNDSRLRFPSQLCLFNLLRLAHSRKRPCSWSMLTFVFQWSSRAQSLSRRGLSGVRPRSGRDLNLVLKDFSTQRR